MPPTKHSKVPERAESPASAHKNVVKRSKSNSKHAQAAEREITSAEGERQHKHKGGREGERRGGGDGDSMSLANGLEILVSYTNPFVCSKRARVTTWCKQGPATMVNASCKNAVPERAECPASAHTHNYDIEGPGAHMFGDGVDS